ncbi:gliding motility lipoprotein GldB [Anditalea andensis]|uniref:Gliding motility protein GldB n=1 Tax=Anditalea andensis TaxID=1048983 RepID=A0A074LIN2_9BACT|nr:gliding motility lipoprotein GldB [Anditalea andensis]KEO73622.1 gliding motility protein GldB [Anditalea andensis]
MIKQAFNFSFLILLISCSSPTVTCELSEDILRVPVDMDIVRMDRMFFDITSEDQLETLLEAHPEFVQDYLQADLYHSRHDFYASMMGITQDTLMQELNKAVQFNFQDFDAVEQELENAFKYIRYHFPDYSVPKIYTFVSGFSNDFYIDDNIIVIGLDYFLPQNHPFQPDDLPQYITKRYQREYLVPTLVTAISSKFNHTDMRDNTLLAEMVFYGKAYHFTKSILPCTPDSLVIGYSQDDILASYANEKLIWSHFVENELLFETNPFEIRKYTGEAPFTDEISPDAPGRIGRWVGWNIVDDYVASNNISLSELMEERSATRIFRQSGYKPRL